jgi:hypothetical protein
MLPLHWQHDFRDSGKFRSLADGMVKLTCPLVAAGRWREVLDFIDLNRPITIDGDNRVKRRWRRELIRYGEHDMQYVDLFWPNFSRDEGGHKCDHRSSGIQENNIRGCIFFVHGGAWGSGQPWMYRLIAPFFLRHGFVVAIVGYRTYPCVKVVTPDLAGASGTDGESQLCDVKNAFNALHNVMDTIRTENQHHEEWVGNVLMG